MIYLDTSALAKWYLNECRSEEFAAWIGEQATVWISSLTRVEVRCLLSRRTRARELSPEQTGRVYAAFLDDVAQGFLALRPFADESVEDASRLIELLPEHPLRTLDALHLAIARRAGASGIATADRVMAAAAAALGLDVVDFSC